MYRLSFVILLFCTSLYAFAQSPHGDELVLDCADCHNPGSWKVDYRSIKFDHESTKFLLEGQHKSTDCIDCHQSMIFKEAPSECISCHTDVHSMTVGADCARCHTSQNWLINNIPELHEQNGFPLIGAHSTLSCQECHLSEANLRFARIGNECISCHREDYLSAESPDHVGSGFSTNCIECHDPLSVDWGSDLSDHSFFPLTKGHDIQDCNECHLTSNFSDASNECSTCHQDDYNATFNPDHQSLNLTNDCASCHTTDPGWIPAAFDGHNDYYQLNGAHAGMANDCAACHNGDYNSTPNTCFGCHQSEYDNSTNPNHTSAQFPTDCIECHSEDDWVPATYDHDGQFFPIYSGKHKDTWTDCIECHTNPDNFAVFTCISCHINPETDDGHTEVPEYIYEDNACLVCHPTGDAEDAFSHDATNFPLTGGHIGIDCNQCHIDGFPNTPTDCFECHTSNYEATSNPNHNAIGIATDCVVCHTTEPGWMPAAFDNHNDYYQLNGAHAAIANDCATCHDGDYNNTQNTCIGCHQSEYDNTTDPNHTSAQFPTDCIQCHTENDWTPATFDHDGQYFPIYSGAHQGEWNECMECHTNPDNFSVFTCITCHTQSETANDHDPDEVPGYVWESNACFACHPNGDASNAFNHDATFPLTGGHIGIDCSQCHADGFPNTPTDCNECHNNNYTATTNPNHTAIGISTDCVVCHTTEPGWNPATFDTHNDYYQLNGAHAGIADDCASCHADGDYNNTSNTCVGCHQNNYNNTTNPNHASAQYSTDCIQCHSENAWTPSTFDHDASNFPLTGAHSSIDCSQCHTDGYPNTPTDCNECHNNNYTATTNPNHSAIGISTDCVVCHTTEPGWMPATFDNHNDYYQLNGAHAGIANDCVVCHNGDYSNTSNTCVGCHQTDYNNTINPNHSSAQFPDDCIQCHTENAWIPATFDHDGQYFPIYSGPHQGEWNDCVECHTTPNNYAIFTCLTCHNQSETDNDHSEVSDYVYESTACLQCHPNANKGFNKVMRSR